MFVLYDLQINWLSEIFYIVKRRTSLNFVNKDYYCLVHMKEKDLCIGKLTNLVLVFFFFCFPLLLSFSLSLYICIYIGSFSCRRARLTLSTNWLRSLLRLLLSISSSFLSLSLFDSHLLLLTVVSRSVHSRIIPHSLDKIKFRSYSSSTRPLSFSVVYKARQLILADTYITCRQWRFLVTIVYYFLFSLFYS